MLLGMSDILPPLPWTIPCPCLLLQEAFPGRFKGIHVINQPWYISIVMAIMMPFMKKKLRDRVWQYTTAPHDHAPPLLTGSRAASIDLPPPQCLAPCPPPPPPPPLSPAMCHLCACLPPPPPSPAVCHLCVCLPPLHRPCATSAPASPPLTGRVPPLHLPPPPPPLSPAVCHLCTCPPPLSPAVCHLCACLPPPPPQVHIHRIDYESLHEFIDPAHLPSDLGGGAPPSETFSAARLFPELATPPEELAMPPE